MTPQELKNSILQLAIQGKLVEQRPEEGTAEELFAQIQEEKQRLIAEKKIKKEKPLPKITEDEKPFEIPESWKWVRLKQVASILYGYPFNSEKFNEINEGMPLIRIRDILSGVTKTFTTEVAPDNYLIYSGDMLVGMDGNFNVNFWTGSPAYLNQRVCKISAVSECLVQEFLYYYLPTALSLIFKTVSFVTVKHLSDKHLTTMLVPLPPLAEQKRIVAKIKGLLPYIDRYEQAWSELEQFNSRFPEDMKKSLLQYAIQGKLVEQCPEEGTAEELFAQIQQEKQRLIQEGKLKKTKALPSITDEEIPADFPSTWKVCYIDDIAFVTKLAGFEYTKNIAPNLTVTGIPLFKGKNVQNGKMVLDFDSYIPEQVSDELSRSQISKKCLLTPYVGTIGNIAIFDGSFKAHLGSNVGKIELLNGEENFIIEEFVLYYLRSQIGYQQLTKYKKATAQESISIDAIRNVIIAFPPLAEQKRIVEKLEQLLPLCERLK